MTSAHTFWTHFKRSAGALACDPSPESDSYRELLEVLQGIAPGLVIELMVCSERCELVITADGDEDLFALARDVVAAAPDVPGWTVIALKPKRGFPAKARWGRLEITVADVVFEPLQRAGGDEFGLRILIPGLAPDDLDDAHNAILRAVDDGLGEEAFARAVRFTEVKPLPRDADPQAFIPLLELDAFLSWRRSKRRPDGN